jgi:hypothetical protein
VKNIGSLNIYLETQNKSTLLWTLSGESGNIWLQGIAPFQSNYTHQLRFEGVRGNGTKGDIVYNYHFESV